MKNNLTELGIRLGKYLHYIHYKRIGTNQLGRMMGSSGALVSNILNGKNFGMNKFLAIGTACQDLNLYWLLTGEGEMLLDGKAEVTEAALREGQSNKKALESEFKIGSLETAVRYQDMTIGAYKAALSAVLTANKDLKEVVSDHLKTISRLTGGGKTT